MDGALLSGDIAPWAGWMIFAVALAIGEIAMPGVFLIWIAIAAAVTGGVAYLFPALSLPFEILVFAGLSLAAAYAGRRWYTGNPVPSSDPLLNDRAARLVGRTVTVIEPIVDGEGRVKVDDGSWSATGPDAPLGARLVVISASGATLSVAWPTA